MKQLPEIDLCDCCALLNDDGLCPGCTTDIGTNASLVPLTVALTDALDCLDAEEIDMAALAGHVNEASRAFQAIQAPRVTGFRLASVFDAYEQTERTAPCVEFRS